MNKELRLREVIEDYLQVRNEKVKIIAEVAYNRGYTVPEMLNELNMQGVTDEDKLDVLRVLSAMCKIKEVV